jgi:hypothetical protein
LILPNEKVFIRKNKNKNDFNFILQLGMEVSFRLSKEMNHLLRQIDTPLFHLFEDISKVPYEVQLQWLYIVQYLCQYVLDHKKLKSVSVITHQLGEIQLFPSFQANVIFESNHPSRRIMYSMLVRRTKFGATVRFE